jgi:hypothetical protein
VETVHDPAVRAIELCCAKHPGRAEFVVAGLAVDEGQKVCNLRAGLARTSTADEILVLADSDFLPEPDWLRRLVGPVVEGQADVVTAYPWLRVEDRQLSTLMFASIFSAVATFPRPTPLNAASGCSAAMWREKFSTLGIMDAWAGAISDDMQMTSVLKKANASIELPRELLLRTPIRSSGFFELVKQVRRWCMLIRIYNPVSFALALLLATVIAAGWAGALAGTIAGRMDAVWFLSAGLALGALRSLAYAVLIGRLWGRAEIVRNCWFVLVNPFVTPIAAIASAALVWSSLFMNRTTWAGITYEVRGPQMTKVLSRTNWHEA